MANPEQACSDITPPSDIYPNYLGNWIVLIRRYGCSFEEKVRAAQRANYSAAIVHNVNSSELGKDIIFFRNNMHYPCNTNLCNSSVSCWIPLVLDAVNVDCLNGACKNVNSDNVL
jgi:hypothetical protein